MFWEMTIHGIEWFAQRGDEWLLLRRWVDSSWSSWSRAAPEISARGSTASGALRAQAARQTDPEIAEWIRSLPEPV